MHIALLVFGQFRAYEEVLDENIQELKKAFPESTFDIYILTDKLISGAYSPEAEAEIRATLQSHQINLKLLSFWEDLHDCHSADTNMTNYMKHSGLPWNSDFLGSLWYRRYILWKLFENTKANAEYDYCVLNRIFDTDIKLFRPIHDVLTQDVLFYAIDTFFIGSPSIMKTLLKFGSNPSNFKDFQWTEGFTNTFKIFDQHIGSNKVTFCSETQILKYILDTYNKSQHKNIRFDYVEDSPSYNDAHFYIRIRRAQRIPKRILQIAIGDEYIRNLPLQLLKDNLTNHYERYEYVLFTDSHCKEFLLTHFPEYQVLYNTLTRPQYKSDLIRYLYLYMFGGYYVDIDILPLIPLRSIYEKSQCSSFICVEGAHTDPAKGVLEMANGFIGTRKNNPIFLDLVAQMAAEPNPEDYGKNVKRFYAAVKGISSQNPPFILKEKHYGQGYVIYFNDEPIALSNGQGYPPQV
jgi:mannosyltransferase OCH1-like enzyme